jgi:FkbM family methyltransferase
MECAHSSEPEIRLLKYLVDPRRVAVDIGAADGIYALHLGRLAHHCIAFEPNPYSYSQLKRVLPEIEIHQAAVSSVDGETVLRVPVVKGIPYFGWGTIEPKNQLSELPPHTLQEIKVRTIRADHMTLGDIGFIKIDVEGHELEVLSGLLETIERCLPNLVIEIGAAERGGSLSRILQWLEPLGYVALRLDENCILRLLPKEFGIAVGSMNIVFIATIRSPSN